MKKLKARDIINYLDDNSYNRFRIILQIRKEDVENNVELTYSTYSNKHGKSTGTINCFDAFEGKPSWENGVWMYVNVSKVFKYQYMDEMENVSLSKFKVEDYALILTYVYEGGN